jgi:CBS domain-containing protein
LEKAYDFHISNGWATHPGICSNLPHIKATDAADHLAALFCGDEIFRSVTISAETLRREMGQTPHSKTIPRMVKTRMTKKLVKQPDRKSTKQPLKLVKEVSCQEPKLLQEKSSLKEAGEQMRSAGTNRLPVASGDHLVGAMEGKYPERTAAGFGHDPKTSLVREIMVKKAYYCVENQSLDQAREIMCEHHLDYLPVVDGNMRVLGIVALKDLGEKRAGNETTEPHSLEASKGSEAKKE